MPTPITKPWPSDPPDQWRFPARNITMSGYTQGTVVIEASSTSGAKMQAQAARAHAKTVFLLKSLATAQPWAQEMLTEARQSFGVGGTSTSPVTGRAMDADLFTDWPAASYDATEQSRLVLPVVEVADVTDVIERIASAKAISAAAELRHRMAGAIPAAL